MPLALAAPQRVSRGLGHLRAGPRRRAAKLAAVTSASHKWDLPEQYCIPRGLAAVRGRAFVLYHPSSPALDRAIAEAEAYLELRKHFDSMGVLIWLGQPFPPPSAEVRAAFAAVFGGSGPKVECVAWVVDSDRSLGASVVRSVSTQMFPGSATVEVFREPFEAAAWLGKRIDGDLTEILDGLDVLDRNYA